MRTLKSVLTGVARVAAWPAYLGLASYVARQGPWPKDVAVPSSAALVWVALAMLVSNLVGWAVHAGGWAEVALGMPPAVTRQVRRAARALALAAVVILMPGWLIASGTVTSGGRPSAAPAVVRVLVLLFELTGLGVAVWVLRRRSAVVGWLTESPDRLGRLAFLAYNRRSVTALTLSGIAGVIALDAFGYGFSARRLATGAAGTVADLAVCWAVYRVLNRLIDRHAWRYGRSESAAAAAPAPGDAHSATPDDLANRLRHLGGLVTLGVGLLLAARVWDVDLALFRFVSEQSVWSVDGKGVEVTVGDLARAATALALCALGWRYMSTGFALLVFPRMPDDPGARYAVVTLGRYAVLGLGLLTALSAVHLGLEKVGVVFAALGVGLGFGLQEILSNFVCGIILLLERPIRVGDIVTVSDLSGKVDRINIRATTIINADNQNIIIPNRAFVTGNLINWTLKDKVIRVTIKVRVALGTDPDQVTEVLLGIARDDADVLRNPVPEAMFTDMGDSGLNFVLFAHVPEPALAGRVKHRLYGQIQRKFAEAGVVIPLPTQVLHLKPIDAAPPAPVATATTTPRFDAPSIVPPAPWMQSPRFTPDPAVECHRGVDE